jgi:NADH-quinone oxidoreductase subunit L
MGGLKDRIPQTYRTFAIATYAIAGLPLAAGFFSKDELLASAWATPYFPGVGKFVWFLGTMAAFCTAFYMYRLLYLTFFGTFRGTHEHEHHLHESPPSMTVPLWILAGLSAAGGLLGIPHIIHGPFTNILGHWLAPVVPEIPGAHHLIEIPVASEITVALISTFVAVAGWLAARALYKEKQLATDAAIAEKTPGLARMLENKYYVDEVYAAVIVRPLERTSVFLWRIVDAVIDGIAAMLGYVVEGVGDLLRFFQTGSVRNYALMFFLAVVVFVWIFA